MVLTSPPGDITSTWPSGVSPGFTAMAVGVGVKGGLAVPVGNAVVGSGTRHPPSSVVSPVAVEVAVEVAVAVGLAVVGSDVVGSGVGPLGQPSAGTGYTPPWAKCAGSAFINRNLHVRVRLGSSPVAESHPPPCHVR
jgi:hypothetical protein